jgi:N-acyl-D-amino-acid deacylase
MDNPRFVSKGVCCNQVTNRLWILVLLSAALSGPGARAADLEDSPTSLRSAIARGLDVVTKAAGRYPENQSCFSCHHQTLPLLAAVTARDHGVTIDQTLLPAQTAFTHASFHDDLDDLREGRRIGGRAMTVGYGLWALRLADAPADETTVAMVTYLFKMQHDDGHWSRQTSRPPLEESNVACTTLAIYGLKNHAAESQRQAADQSIEKAARWLDQAAIASQEDRCFRLWSLDLLGASAEQIAVARQTVLASQRNDGGWAQLDTMASDAYATGQTLWMLQVTGFDAAEEAYRRGAKYLLSTQCDDGSWFVRSRSKPVQPYFDNGDPHGKDQFISTPATCWAVAALAAAVKDKADGKP